MKIVYKNILVFYFALFFNLFADQTVFDKALSMRPNGIFNSKKLKNIEPYLDYIELDLSDVDFDTEFGKNIIEKIKTIDVSGVKVINLKNSTNVEIFLEALFYSRTPFSFVSLRSIRAENTDITPIHVKKIHEVMSSLAFYVRDLRECYARHNIWAILLKIDVSNLFEFREGHFINGMYSDDSEKIVGYRAEGFSEKLPFITFVGKN